MLRRDLHEFAVAGGGVLLLGSVLAFWGAIARLPHPAYAYGDEHAFYWGLASSTFANLGFSTQLSDMAAGSWQTSLSRWTIPAVLTVFVLIWLRTVVRNPLRRMLIVRRGKHAIVAGLAGGGLTFARSERRRGRGVLALLPQTGSPEAAQAVAKGMALLTAKDGVIPRKAGLAQAACFAALTDDDARNFAEAAAAIGALGGTQRRKPLGVHLRIESLRLRDLAGDDLARENRNVRLNVFSTATLTARAYFETYAPDRFAPAVRGARLRVQIFGFGPLGQQILLEHLRLAWLSNGTLFEYAVIDRDAQRLRRDFLARYPGAADLAPLDFHAIDFEDGVELEKVLAETRAKSAAIFVCLTRSEPAVAAALQLERILSRKLLALPPIYLAGTDDSAVAMLRDTAALNPEGIAFLQGLRDEEGLFDSDFILAGRLDRGARAVHEDYLRTYVPKDAVGTRPLWRPWAELAEEARDDNRAVVSHLAIKLRDWGFRLSASGDPSACVLPEAAIEPLARAEHERWLANRMLAGWRYGAERDDGAKRHPDMVPYDELPEATKDKDRSQIRALADTIRTMKSGVKRDWRVALLSPPEETSSDDGRRSLRQWLRQRADAEPLSQTVVVSTLRSDAERRAALLARECGAVLWTVLGEPVYAVARRLEAADRALFYRLVRSAERILRVDDTLDPDPVEALNGMELPAHAQLAFGTVRSVHDAVPLFRVRPRASVMQEKLR